MAEKRKLYIYEALELRSEYDARIKTLKDTLPETRQNRDRLFYSIQEMMMVVVVPALISIWQKYADSSESLK